MANLAIQAQAQEINAIAKFESNLHNLLAILNKEDVSVMAPGTAHKTYKSSGSLSTATVAEKGAIPDSGIAMGDAIITELTFGKYRNLVGIESIGKKGYDVAVGGSAKAMVGQAQAKLRKSIIDGMDITGVTEVEVASTVGFQARVAKAAGKVATKFEDEAYTPIFFVNPEYAFDYLGTANVTVQNEMGINYITNFLGLGTLILDSNVTSGEVFGTACENLDVVACNMAAIEGMDMTTDESGILGIHIAPAYANGAIETVVYSGLKALPVFADRVVKVGE